MAPPLTIEQLAALQHIYDIPEMLQNGCNTTPVSGKAPRRSGRCQLNAPESRTSSRYGAHLVRGHVAMLE
jgi:hypothetical protein